MDSRNRLQDGTASIVQFKSWLMEQEMRDLVQHHYLSIKVDGSQDSLFPHTQVHCCIL